MIDSYDKLTVGKWLELKNVNLEQEEIDIQMDILSILSDMSIDEIMTIPLAEYSKMVSDSMFLSQEPPAMKKLPSTVKVDNKDFTIVQKIETMTAGQYIDYQEYLKREDLPHILTCFVIPKGCKYGEGYDLEETSEFFKQYLPIGIALAISRFFFTLWVSLMNAMLDSSIKNLKKTARKTKNKELKKKLAQLKSL